MRRARRKIRPRKNAQALGSGVKGGSAGSSSPGGTYLLTFVCMMKDEVFANSFPLKCLDKCLPLFAEAFVYNDAATSLWQERVRAEGRSSFIGELACS